MAHTVWQNQICFLKLLLFVATQNCRLLRKQNKSMARKMYIPTATKKNVNEIKHNGKHDYVRSWIGAKNYRFYTQLFSNTNFVI